MARNAWTLSYVDSTLRERNQAIIKELGKASFDPNQQCPACIAGKAHQEIRPRSREHQQLPLEQVYIDRVIVGYIY